MLERRHTVSSEFLGYDEVGNPRFRTARSELGELVFQLKNRGNRTAADTIADSARFFLAEWKPPYDCIVPVPASRRRANFQPTEAIADALSPRTDVPALLTAVRKIKATPQLKDVFDLAKRSQLLAGAFTADPAVVGAKRILLVDDLYRSGATAAAVTHALLAAGARSVYMLAITKTRTRA